MREAAIKRRAKPEQHDLMDAPPTADEGLARLMAAQAPWAESGATKASR